MQEKSGGVNLNQGVEFTSIMMISELPIGELKEISIDEEKGASQNEEEKQDEKTDFNSQDRNAVLKAQSKRQDKIQTLKEIANSSEDSRFKNEVLSTPIQRNEDKVQTLVSGNTKEQIKSYQALLMAHLTQFKKYPQEAIIQKQEGVVKVRISIDENGNVLSKELKKSCPYAVLNDEVLSLFQRASPLPKPPKEILRNEEKISFVMPIEYSIKDHLGKNKPLIK